MASSIHKAKEYGRHVIGRPDHVPKSISTVHWAQNIVKDPKRDIIDYLFSLFPILGWIGRYNIGWLSGDLIAGITVGIVLVPQSMSYAQIATLPLQFGLYSAFVGVFIYCFFATSKDVSIGPVAVMSLTVSQIIAHVNAKHPKEFPPETIATAVAFVSGFIVLGIGLLRLGWIVEFIPLPAVTGFMTGSAINIASGQVPGLMGITGFNTRAATYLVIINTLKGLPRTTLDAAFGLPPLAVLYFARWGFDRLSKRYPKYARVFFFMSIMRNGLILIIMTIASWLYTRHRKSAKGTYPIKILQTVPRGFQDVGPPTINRTLISAIADQLPVATIILLLEHIAIAKSFGRVNDYKINPNQELIAIGVTNTVGSVFNAYPATGSFSRTALKAKCGVRTPLAGWFTGIVVIVALYGLTPAFFWIPTAGISAIIIHAVTDLVTSPRQVYGYWRYSPLEFVIWFATVLVTIFATIEIGVYVTVIASVVLLLIRVAHPRGNFLGRARVSSPGGDSKPISRDVFIPLRDEFAEDSEKGITVTPPYPGVIVYRFEESILYPNCSLLNDRLVDYVRQYTRRGKDLSGVSIHDRPWNDPGPKKGHEKEEYDREQAKPLLKAVVLDFITVSHIDLTGMQALVDTRKQIERWADRSIEFHFANILSPWIRRALIAGGFGGAVISGEQPFGSLNHGPEPSIPPYGDDLTGGAEPEHTTVSHYAVDDVESGYPNKKRLRSSIDKSGASSSDDEGVLGQSSGDQGFGVDLFGQSPETPFFHFDLTEAVRAAEAHAKRVDTGSR